jgi:hypothetical protein
VAKHTTLALETLSHQTSHHDRYTAKVLPSLMSHVHQQLYVSRP